MQQSNFIHTSSVHELVMQRLAKPITWIVLLFEYRPYVQYIIECLEYFCSSWPQLIHEKCFKAYGCPEMPYEDPVTKRPN